MFLLLLLALCSARIIPPYTPGTKIAPVSLNTITTATQEGFDEQQCVILPTDLWIDQGKILAGTAVSSHLIFRIPPENSPATQQIVTWFFDATILGTQSDTNGKLMAASDSILGLKNLTYPGVTNGMGLESDEFALFTKNKLCLSMRGSDTDIIRVITGCVQPITNGSCASRPFGCKNWVPDSSANIQAGDYVCHLGSVWLCQATAIIDGTELPVAGWCNGNPSYQPGCGLGNRDGLPWKFVTSCSDYFPLCSTSPCLCNDPDNLIPPWSNSTTYIGCERVQNRGAVFEVLGWPQSGWANQPPYQPGMGSLWESAFTRVGECSESFVISLDCQGMSYPQWVVGLRYNPGDIIQREGYVWECREYPNSGWCGVPAYEPRLETDSGVPNGLTLQAWNLLGRCT